MKGQGVKEGLFMSQAKPDSEKLSFTGRVHVSKEVVESLIVSAIEGGSNYWYRIEGRIGCDYLKLAFSPVGMPISNKGSEPPFIKGRLTPTTIQMALDLMAEKYPRHFADILADREDAATGDVFLQLAILGTVMYG